MKFLFIGIVLIVFNALFWFIYTKGNVRKSIGITVAIIVSVAIALLLTLL